MVPTPAAWLPQLFLTKVVTAATSSGCTVSIDLNYRKKLWNYGKKASEVMRGLVALADVVVATLKLALVRFAGVPACIYMLYTFCWEKA